jgi:aminoglycoside phosphotransferase (APT) family kinase protein
MNIEATAELLDYLRRHGRVRDTETPRLTVLMGGVSNRTVLVERAGGPEWVLKQALAKLRVATDWFSSPERIHQEALGLRWLHELAPPGSIPRFLFEDHEHHILAMTAVPRPHENWKTMLLRGEIVPDHVRQFGRLLADIHHGAMSRRAELEPIFRDTSFFESLRVEPYYAFSGRQTPAAAEFLEALIAETRATRRSLVHGDFSPKNVLVREERLVLLDHEVIHWGDPAFDLGFSLAHFLSKAHHFPAWRAEFARAAHLYWQSYDDRSSEQRAVRHVLGCLLARVDGRSPLEYLGSAERGRQRAAVLRLMAKPPAGIGPLIDQFISCL